MSTQTVPAGSPRPWRRWLWIGGGVVVVLVVLVVVFGPSYTRAAAIRNLNSSDNETRKSGEDYLRKSQDPATDEALLDEVRDDGNTFDLRLRCATLLKERSRVDLMDHDLRAGDLGTRCVILTALFREPFFRKTFLNDPAYRVGETVREWLGRDGDPNRANALQIAIAFRVEGVVPLLAGLLRRSDAIGRNPTDVQLTLIAAGQAVFTFRDCADVPLLLDLAERDPDAVVKRRSMENLEPLLLTPTAVCPDAVPADRVKAVLVGALDTPGTETAPRSIRMKAMMLLRHRPEWVKDARVRIEEILDAGSNGAERRLALEVLAVGQDPAFLATMPKWFHDRDPDVRSSAVLMAPGIAVPRLEGCLIGILRDETASLAAFTEALRGLNQSAKEWLGVPDAIVSIIRLEAREHAIRQLCAELFARGESQGVTRDGLALTWFAWWAKNLELSEEETAKAIEVRAAFRKAMDAGDVGAATIALKAFLPRHVEGLFAYEEGWLVSRATP